MTKYKLTIELLPRGAWGNDFSRTLSKKDWDILRNKCYERANHRCQICGFETDELDAHEVWDFDSIKKTQTLIDIIGICSKCHGVKHYRNSQRLGFSENAKRHFMKVNKCSELDFAKHLASSQFEYNENNRIYRWNIIADLDRFGGKGIKIKKIYLPYILSEYSADDIIKLANCVSFNPRIINIDVDNYKGTITVYCDKTYKIIWYSDKNKILEKFNFSEMFKTEFSVKDIKYNSIYFVLYGEYGDITSKTFYLKNWDNIKV